MISWIKLQWRAIAKAAPGERFALARRRLRAWEQGRPARILLSLCVACILILIGALFGFLPLLPGFFLGVPGIALLIGRTKGGAMTLDRAELFFRRWRARWRARWQSSNKPRNQERAE